MAATSHAVQGRESSGPLPMSYPIVIKNGAQIYNQSFVSIENASGLAIPYTGAATERLLGKAEPGGSFQGATIGLGNTTVANPPQVIVRLHAYVAYSISVVGATSSAVNGQAVYLLSNNTYTLTQPTVNDPIVGKVLRWISGTSCDVYILGFNDRP